MSKYGLPALFGMQVYGNTERNKYTPRVHSFFWVVSILMVLQFGIDYWAWSAAGLYAIGDTWWRFILALPFAALITLVDLSFFLTDLREIKTTAQHNGNSGRLKWMLGLRILAMFLIPFITAIPLELRIFDDEITTRIESVEKTRIDEIRVAAAKQETENFDQRVDGAKSKLDADLDKRDAELKAREKALADYTTDVNKERTGLEDEAERARICYECEMTGDCGRFPQCAASAGYGVGKVAAKKQIASAEAAKRLADFNEAQKTNTRTNELQLAVSKRLAQLEGDVKVLEAEKEAAILATQTMDPEALSLKYGGSWKEPRGFLQRMNVLDEMASEDGDVLAAIWGCRLVMLLFPLILLIMKFGVPEDVQSYLSVEEQARDGNPHAIRALRGKRPEMLQQFGFDKDHFDLNDNLRDARSALIMVLGRWQDRILELVQPKDNGLCRTHQEVVGELRKFWMEEVLPAFIKHEEIEGRYRDRGMEIPGWNDVGSPIIADPRGSLEPWKLTVEQLEAFGWVDPAAKIDAAEAAQHELRRGLQVIRRTVNGPFRQHLRDVISWDREAGVDQIHTEMFDFWAQHMQGNVERIEELVEIIRRGGAEPQWLRGVPPLEQLQELWMVGPRRLAAEGWQGEYEALSQSDWVDPTVIDRRPASEPIDEEETDVRPEPTDNESSPAAEQPHPLAPNNGELHELMARFRAANPGFIANVN